ncbi:AMP-binding protein, partial [Micromonospora sp. NPDC000089]|uniref:AMP-binding protein n=1 Tax=unclassified Micromonospora TaxID=2617518 RepID=UPI0036B20526
MPFERVVEAVNPPRSAGRNPLFQIMQQVNLDGPATPQLPGLETEEFAANLEAARFDIAIMLQASRAADQRPGPIEAIIRFAVDLFDAATVRRLFARMVRLLESVVADPGQSLNAIELLDAEERARLLRQGDGRELVSDPVVALTLPQAFGRQVARTPSAVAVHCGGNSLTYRELDERANRLAHQLIEAGAGPGRPVATVLDPSVEFVVSMLAVLKSGSYCVPLRPALAPDRLRLVLDRYGVQVLLTARTTNSGALPDCGTVVWADDVDPARPGTDPVVAGRHTDPALAAVGTTAGPVGLAVTHQGVLDQLNDSLITPQDLQRVLIVAPYGLDPSAPGLWFPLTRGGTVVIADEDDLSAEQVGWLVEDEHVTAVDVPAGLFAVLAEERPAALASVREVTVRGRVPSSDAVRRILRHCPGIRVRTGYGPAEMSLLAASASWGQASEVPDRLPIGRPCDGISAYVLDENLALSADGVVGELCLTGRRMPRDGLVGADPQSDRFVTNPFDPTGARLYRTGDRVRWNPDGQLDWGAAPHLVAEIRGHRFELAEIEIALASHPGIAEAAVLVRQDAPGARRLVAYVVPHDELDVAELDEYARWLLPAYQVPDDLVVLDQLPRHTDGRFNEAALSAPVRTSNTAPDRGQASAQEEILCGLFAEVLGVDMVGVDDNFFDLGGHSLLATQLVSLIRSAFRAEVAVRAVFEAATPAGLARRLDTAGRGRTALSAMPRPEQVPMSYAQQRLWFLNQLEGPSATYNLPFIYRLTGRLDVDAFQLAVDDVVARHEILRTLLREVDGQPVQVVMPAAAQPVHRSRCTEQDVPEMLQRAVEYVFDLATENAMRVDLISVDGTDDYVLMVLFHHSVSDGISARPFGADLSVAYRARVAGRVPQWAPLPLQYADYALWQRSTLGAE